MKYYFFAIIILITVTTGCKEDDQAVIPLCEQLPDAGPCEAYFPKYYFDQDEQQCKEFIWGGCEGNVPFDSYLACQQACGGSLDSLGRCEMVPDPGPCDAIFPRYYYDQVTGMCAEFIWGGCDGIVPFETLQECQELCE